LACAIYPMPTIERLIHDGNVWTVTCSGCRTALAVVITCPTLQDPPAPRSTESRSPTPTTPRTAPAASTPSAATGGAWTRARAARAPRRWLRPHRARNHLRSALLLLRD
jgi:hypothetical protein